MIFIISIKEIMETKEKEISTVDLLFDMCILNVAVIISSIILAAFSNWKIPNISVFTLHANLSYLITYLFFNTNNLYLTNGFYPKFNRITKRTLVFLLVSLLIEFLVFSFTLNKIFFFQYAIVFYVGQLIFYWLRHKYFSTLPTQFSVNHAVIVGLNPTGKYLRKIIDNNPSLGLKFIGFVEQESQSNHEVLGDVEDLPNLIDQHQIHIVFVTLSVFDEKFRGKEYLRICNKKGIRLRFIPENERLNKFSKNIEVTGNLMFINPQEIPLDDAKARFLKRTFDIVFSSLVIVFLLSWLFPIVALLIKLNSKGPIFFVQKRTCLNNRVFNCFKFRSMKVNEQADTQQATDSDSRITKLGKILRKSNIDELPQFFNVLLGHMSISGPRPHMLKHTHIYSELIDYYQIRHYVKPGITGWAQVNGYRGETDELWKMEKRVEYDLDYIENWNFWWDLKIIILTVTNMKYVLPKMTESQRTSTYDYPDLQLRKLND